MRYVKQQHANDRHAGEQDYRRNQTRQVFPYHQHFAAHGAEKIKVQTTIDDVPAEKVHEDPGTSKKYYRAQDQSAVIHCEDRAVVIEVLKLAVGWSKGCQQEQWSNRQQCQ